ncbi:hypothetical protein SAMN06296065_104130 [Novosphingobium panipatense]|uniref:Uncharacterized protein n=1 Tax=Novosphingobium panipatense TaxID=428991 RepID=A0ABY1QD17_9SPHN|nr:hypothetical protein SAMN06296065_104130 [Novosphingobium panipatense]
MPKTASDTRFSNLRDMPRVFRPLVIGPVSG